MKRIMEKLVDKAITSLDTLAINIENKIQELEDKRDEK